MRRLLLIPTLLALVILSPPAQAQTFTAQLVKGGLAFPATFTFTPSGKVVYGERFSGNIRIYDPSTNTDTLFFTVTNVVTQGEQGLLGLAVDPQLTSGKPFVYAYATRNVSGSLKNQILRIKIRSGRPPTSSVIFSSNTTPGDYHDGGRILFGPDGKLYAVIGESHTSANAQDLGSTAGKIVRMSRNGTAPSDNPFVGVAGNDFIYSFGHRNSYGFTFDPQTGNLWETENGPECNDEINRPVKGGNFAWGPNETCSGTAPGNTNQDGPTPRILPLLWYVDTIAPTGDVFCNGCGLSGSEGTLFFADNNQGQIHRLVLTANRLGIASQSVVYDHPRAAYSMERGIDGALYFSDDSGIYKLV
jgi:glucose/arabinose dehydrogenase